jgi:uncharacterized membrane protein
VILVTTLYLLSLVVWIGGVIFFSFIGAPSIFKVLPPEYAGKAVGAIFPKYYPMGIVSGIVAFACLIFSAARTGHWPVGKILAILLMLVLTTYSSLVTHPKARALREEMQIATGKSDVTEIKKQFDRVHFASVINNGIILFLGVVLIAATARRLTL